MELFLYSRNHKGKVQLALIALTFLHASIVDTSANWLICLAVC